IGKYNMVKLPFGVPYVGDKHWNGCLVKPEQDCANPKPSAWTKSAVYTVITDKFKKSSGPAANYLKSRVYPGKVMNSMLVYMQANQADGADAAAEFLKKHENIWKKWVPADVAAKVKG
ncbi:MAG TPA: ABC transporter substrate-binding protein, partial [Rhodospirillales bacterium]|nr:ABC transporter substrate-binding protein [Rhodospirillales bacterium]